jgi:hypothetical protein
MSFIKSSGEVAWAARVLSSAITSPDLVDVVVIGK